MAKKLISEMETHEMSFDDLVKSCVQMDMDHLVEGRSMYSRIFQICQYACAWQAEKIEHRKKMEESKKAS